MLWQPPSAPHRLLFLLHSMDCFYAPMNSDPEYSPSQKDEDSAQPHEAYPGTRVHAFAEYRRQSQSDSIQVLLFSPLFFHLNPENMYRGYRPHTQQKVRSAQLRQFFS